MQTKTREHQRQYDLCGTMGCQRRASIAVSSGCATNMLLCMRCAQLHVRALSLSAEKGEEHEVTAIEPDFFGNYSVILDSGDAMVVGKEANATFYTAHAGKKVTKETTFRGIAVANTYLDSWQEYRQSIQVVPKLKMLYLIVQYVGHPKSTKSKNVSLDAAADGVPWPTVVRAEMLPCIEQEESLCGWHAVANCLARFVEIIQPFLDDNSALSSASMQLGYLAEETRDRNQNHATENDLDASLKVYPLKMMLKTMNILVTIARSDSPVLQSALERLNDESDPVTLMLAALRGKTKANTARLMRYLEALPGEVFADFVNKLDIKSTELPYVYPTHGVTVVHASIANIIAFFRLLTPNAAELLPLFILADANRGNVEADTNLALKLSAKGYSAVISDLMMTSWNFIRDALYEGTNCSFIYNKGSFDTTTGLPLNQWVETQDKKPPGILIMDSETSQYPLLTCMNGRAAGFVVNTNLPALVLTANPLSDSPSINVTVEKGGSSTTIDDRPDWADYGHWVSAVLNVTETGAWNWEMRDSLYPNVTKERLVHFGCLVRELTIYVLGMIQAYAALDKYYKEQDTIAV